MLDSSVWLTFYQLAESSSTEYLTALKRLKARIWMPYQVGNEYWHGREKVVRAQLGRHKVAVSEVEKLVNKVKEFVAKQEHPHFSEADASDLFLASEDLVRLIEEKGDEAKARYDGHPDKDPVLDEVEALVGDKVGSPLDPDIFVARLKAGQVRFEARVPPGYLDAPKTKEGRFPYGDFFIWEEVIELAKKQNLPLVFATADYKDDWWIRDSQPLKPRPELLTEFAHRVGKPITLLTSKAFFRELAKLATDAVSEGSKAEARRLTHDEMEHTLARLEKMHAFEELSFSNLNLPTSFFPDEALERLRALSQPFPPEVLELVRLLGEPLPSAILDRIVLKYRSLQTREDESDEKGRDASSEGDEKNADDETTT